MTELKFNGVIPILVTPFKSDETIDVASLRSTVTLMKRIGVNGVTILGVLGEANRLTDREREIVISEAVDEAGNLPVIVGTSAAGTKAVIEHNEIARKNNASAVMITPHAEPTPSDERILQHFKMIKNESALPIILQDHPASTGVHMSSELISRLIDEIDGFAGIKMESVPTAPKVAKLKETHPQINVMTGLGALYAKFDLRSGSDGFNTGFAFPEVLKELVASAKATNWQRVDAVYKHFLPLIVYEQQPGVAIRKELLRMRGAIQCSKARSPGAQVTTQIQETLKSLVKELMADQDLTAPIDISKSLELSDQSL